MNHTRISHPSSRRLTPCAGALFDCVAQQDYEGLLHVLAAEGVRVLEPEGNHAPSRTAVSCGSYSSEFMQDSHPQQETKSDPYRPLTSHQHQVAAYGALVSELSQFMYTEQQQYQPTKAPSHSQTQRSQRRVKLEFSREAEVLLRASLAAFVDVRPPADFVVYADHDAQPQQQQPADPPLFDGAVANATPPSLDGGPSGGAGTLMHLATALDQPLVLALCLALGGDARACHTAFRRLLIHEAACNGSLQCLTLLLELGRQCGQNNAGPCLPSAETPRRLASASLPFLPRRLDRAQALSVLPFLAQSSSPPAIPDEEHDPPTNVVALLQHFRTMVKQVRQGSLTELQAARLVLQQVTLKPVSQRALARACQFHHHATPSLSRTTVWRGGGSLDGHGNTPLHWAAFKNETACVSLLLSYGADPNARAHPSGWTPLHDAAYSNSVQSIALLVRAGAHVDARANSGATPLCFAAQEDADQAVELLLEQGANLATRCAGSGDTISTQQQHQQQQTSRFSGYTPLHYCAHYNARRAARILLRHTTARRALEIPDLNERLPIHVAVARGSANVLRELLHAGARVETRWAAQQHAQHVQAQAAAAAETPRRRPPSPEESPRTPTRRHHHDGGHVTPVSSPVLRSMIPSQPVTSAKPWNCLTQQNIDECRHLISQAESHWSVDRHMLFTPADRQAVRTVLMLGRRLEQERGIFPEVWSEVLSFCGRGWFEVDDGLDGDSDMEDDEEQGHDLSFGRQSRAATNQTDHLSLPSF